MTRETEMRAIIAVAFLLFTTGAYALTCDKRVDHWGNIEATCSDGSRTQCQKDYWNNLECRYYDARGKHYKTCTITRDGPRAWEQQRIECKRTTY